MRLTQAQPGARADLWLEAPVGGGALGGERRELRGDPHRASPHFHVLDASFDAREYSLVLFEVQGRDLSARHINGYAFERNQGVAKKQQALRASLLRPRDNFLHRAKTRRAPSREYNAA